MRHIPSLSIPLYAVSITQFEQTSLIYKERSDFVHSGYYTDEMPNVYGTGQAGAFQISQEEAVQYLRELAIDPVSIWKIAPSIWSKLFRKGLIQEAYIRVPNDISYGEDLLCLCHCIMRSKRISISCKAHYHYVTRHNSVYREKNVKKIEKEHRLYEALCDLLRQYGVYDELRGDLEQLYLYSLTNCLRYLGKNVCQLYQYPSLQNLAGKKIILYGIGEVGQDYYTQMRRDARCEVLAVTDSQHRKYPYEFMNLIAPEEIFEYPFDVIVVAVLYEGSAFSIKKWLLEKGVREENILWEKPELAIQWET